MSGSPISVNNGAPLGTSPPSAALTSGSTDGHGGVSLGSGTSPTTGVLFTLIMGNSFNGVGITPAVGVAVSLMPMKQLSRGNGTRGIG